MSILDILEELFKCNFLRSDKDREDDKNVKPSYYNRYIGHNYSNNNNDNNGNGYHTANPNERFNMNNGDNHTDTGEQCYLCGTSNQENIEMYGDGLTVCDVCNRHICCACGVVVEENEVGCACLECVERLNIKKETYNDKTNNNQWNY